MSYNNENYYKLREEYAEKPLRAIERADARKTELRQKVEGYAELDDILAATASRIMGAAMEGREGLDARIAKIKRETAETRDAMQILLKSAGYPADYADVHYECTACGDTGFIGTKMCACFRRALTLRGYESAGVARLIATQSFDTFSLDYYKRDPQVYARMQHNFEAARELRTAFFAEDQSVAALPRRYRARQDPSVQRDCQGGLSTAALTCCTILATSMYSPHLKTRGSTAARMTPTAISRSSF